MRWLWLLAVLCISLLGCSEPPRGIVVWHASRGGEQQAFEAIAKQFEQDTGTKVTLLALPYDAYAAKLEAAIPRGNGPDVFISPHERIGTYVQNQLIAEIPDSDHDAEIYEAGPIRAVTTDKRWAVPLASKCVALYTTLAEPPKTLDALVADRKPGVFPLAYEAQAIYFHIPLLHAYGGQLFDGAHYAMVGPQAEKAAERARDLTTSGAIPEEPSGDLVKQLFISGKASSVISGPWLAGDLPKGFSYRVVPLPSIEGAGPMRPYLTVDGAFLTPEGAKRKEAVAFAKALGTEPSAKIRAEVGKQVVANKAYWKTATDPLLVAFHEASQEAVPMPSSVDMRTTWVPAEQALRKVIRREPAGPALAEGKARFEDFMRPPPPSPSRTPLLVLISLVLVALGFMAVRRSQQPGFKKELAASKTAYKYVTHAALTIIVLVVMPLVAGAATSFFAGQRDAPRYVGFTNYIEVLTARGQPLLSSGSFYMTLLVTVLWTVVNVVFHVGIGLVLGILLARPYLRLRAIYRVLLILPWAVPSYVTALAWKGMFHRQFGAVNAILVALGAEPVSWFAKFSTAFSANVATNVWLGFPFMMVVVMGALTSISKDVLEAAEVDGATRWQAFRLVTLPLLRPTLLPAVILGSVWTFNMFNVVFLVSGGEPDGTTDILVSDAYRWAFTRNAQFGYAAAYAVIIFGVLALMTRVLGSVERRSESRA